MILGSGAAARGFCVSLLRKRQTTVSRTLVMAQKKIGKESTSRNVLLQRAKNTDQDLLNVKRAFRFTRRPKCGVLF